MDNVEQIKSKLDIIDIINEYVPLKKAGVNWKACCPFHNEKTPSFMVNQDRQFWHCFGCNEGGDMFTFIQKIEGLEFPEALHLLAQKAGVQVQKIDPRLTSRKNRLNSLLSLTARFWQNNLREKVGQKARDYLKKRGIQNQAVVDFKLGYANDSWDELLNFLKRKEYTEAEIFEAGLLVKKDSGGYYDRFRDRLIFPIQDMHGQVIGFTGRSFNDNEGAKYINTPESPLYHKGSVLYGLDKAKQAIRKNNYAVIVEGNMDVIACHQAGYKHVLACSGTALTADQVRSIKRYTENVALCLDNDEAGQTATRRSVDILYGEDMNVKIVQLVSGKDPDECLKNSPQDWEQSLRQSKLAMQFYFDHYLTKEVLSDINKKKQASKILLAEISKLKNKVEQTHWLKLLADLIDVPESILKESLAPVKTSIPVKAQQPAPVQLKKAPLTEYGERFLTILFNFQKLTSYAQEQLAPEMLVNNKLARFYKSLIIYYNSKEEKTNFLEWLAKQDPDFDKDYFNSLELYIDKVYDGFSEQELQQELMDLINKIKISFFEQRIKLLRQRLIETEKNSAKEGSDQLIREIQLNSEQLSKLK